MCAVSDKRHRSTFLDGWGPGIFISLAALVAIGAIATATVGARADNFTDIFYTNSFRGAFEWIKKFDWVGMIVQFVISTFSLFGVALLTIRIMTSMLYLSAKGMWEEVHDLKSQSTPEEKDFLGFVSMAKTWATGKSTFTGLDAIIGAVLMLLPDVKRYSDFGEKAKGDFSDDVTITQYILKIALPTVMTVFFFAMGFNGTLFQALAVTVDGLGFFADKIISVNYTGYVDDLINSGIGYKFAFNADGTNLGDFKQGLAKTVYGQVVSKVRGADSTQLYEIGQKVEEKVKDLVPNPQALAGNNVTKISDKVRTGLSGTNLTTGESGAGSTVQSAQLTQEQIGDNYVPYMGYEVLMNGSDVASGAFVSYNVKELLPESMGAAEGTVQDNYIHIFISQTTDFNGSYFNLDNAA